MADSYLRNDGRNFTTDARIGRAEAVAKVNLTVQAYGHAPKLQSFDVVQPCSGGKILKDSKGYLWKWTNGFITSQGPNPSIFNGRTDIASEV